MLILLFMKDAWIVDLESVSRVTDAQLIDGCRMIESNQCSQYTKSADIGQRLEVALVESK